MPSIGAKDVAYLLEQLSSDLIGTRAGQAAAAGDQQQQQDQDRTAQRNTGSEEGGNLGVHSMRLGYWQRKLIYKTCLCCWLVFAITRNVCKARE
jgi:hypothetical protein